MRSYKSDFYSGALTFAAVTMIIQDIYGKEAYLAIVQNRWIPWYYSVPMAIILLIIAGQLREEKP